MDPSSLNRKLMFFIHVFEKISILAETSLQNRHLAIRWVFHDSFKKPWKMELSPTWQPQSAIFDVCKKCCIFICHEVKIALSCRREPHFCNVSLLLKSTYFLYGLFESDIFPHKMHNVLPERLQNVLLDCSPDTPAQPRRPSGPPGLKMSRKFNQKSSWNQQKSSSHWYEMSAKVILLHTLQIYSKRTLQQGKAKNATANRKMQQQTE